MSSAPSGPGDSKCDHLLLIIRWMYTVHVDNHLTVSESDAHPEKPVPEAAERRINEIAKVTQPDISPSNSHHAPTSGARTSEHKAGGKEDN